MAWRLAVLGAALCLFGCGGGGGGSPQPQVVFQVTAITPVDLSAGVPLTEQINVVFSKPVDPDTVDSMSFEVIAESGDIIFGQREVPQLNPSIVRFRPQKYLPFAIHMVRVKQTVLDADGAALDREYEFTFQTESEGPVLPTQNEVRDMGGILSIGRFFHRMTLLPSNRFILTGGYLVEGQQALGSAENLIPSLGQSTIIPSSLRGARAAHVQVMLHDGRVLLAGGEVSATPFVPLKSCEVFDPANGFRFFDVAPMNVARSLAHGTVLPDGRVLVTGGQSTGPTGNVQFRSDAELYDPMTDSWTLLPSEMEVGRSTHFSALTPAGDVVVIGGTLGDPSATLFRSASETFSQQLGTPFAEHFFGAGAVLPDGRPLVAGGLGFRAATIFDPAFGFLSGLNQMADERVFATATAFADGRVLIVGGFDFTTVPPLVHNTVDVFFPVGATGKFFRATDLQLPAPTSHHAAAIGPNGAVWITGGLPLQVGFPAIRQVVVILPESP